MDITLQHFAFIIKYVAYVVAQSLLFATVAITRFRKKMHDMGPFPRYCHNYKENIFFKPQDLICLQKACVLDSISHRGHTHSSIHHWQ